MFKITEFSKIVQVSRRLLQYYDDIGLFAPAYTDPHTGYRFYTADQLPAIARILALKDLGLSLDQIRRMTHADLEPSEIRGMLALKRAQLEQAVRDDLYRLWNVELRLKQLESLHTPYNIVLKSIPAQPYWSLRRQLTTEADMGQFFFEVYAAAPHPPYLAIVHAPVYEQDFYDLEVGFTGEGVHLTDLLIPAQGRLTYRELEAVAEMVTLTHEGAGHPGLYQALGVWMETHGYGIAGPEREVFWQLGSPDHPEQHIVEIQIPVTRSAT